MGLQNRLQEQPAQAAIGAARAFYGSLESRLTDDRAWLLGAFSYADIAFYMAALFGERQGATLTQDTPRLMAWRDRMSRREPVRKVAGAMASWLLAAGRPLPPFMRALLG